MPAASNSPWRSRKEWGMSLDRDQHCVLHRAVLRGEPTARLAERCPLAERSTARGCETPLARRARARASHRAGRNQRGPAANTYASARGLARAHELRQTANVLADAHEAARCER